MNEQIQKLAADARGQMTVLTTVDEEQWKQHEEFVETFAKLIINECADICYNLRYTKEGPSENAAYQRTLCGSAIKENFGLLSKGPITALNVK